MKFTNIFKKVAESLSGSEVGEMISDIVKKLEDFNRNGKADAIFEKALKIVFARGKLENGSHHFKDKKLKISYSAGSGMDFGSGCADEWITIEYDSKTVFSANREWNISVRHYETAAWEQIFQQTSETKPPRPSKKNKP